MEKQPDLLPPKAKDNKVLQSQLGNAKEQALCFINNTKGVKETLGADRLKDSETLYFKFCDDCEYIVDAKCTKILIESCKNTKITIKGTVITATLEVWKCEGVELHILSKVLTLQADLCRGLKVHYSSKNNYDRTIWAGVFDFHLSFGDHEDIEKKGLDQMKEEFQDLNDDIDQFIVRFLDNKLTTEQIVRLPNGFPTTEREAQIFDEEAKKNAEATEAYVRKLLDAKSSKLGLKALQKKRVPRNGPCSCGSGKKYKVCCGKV
eukprot:TRINITY_DN6147_c0_g1_i1.p1 TRINITY_DN6147_c0_g1~~TRINITY_DN6147_c0_g1_i1.p1  ORF type:complete len:263 (+),score=56.12 TRINITY_DN6147_c0_g1_i1:328-1116(+)